MEAKGEPVAAALIRVKPVADLDEIAARVCAHEDVIFDRFHIARVGVFGSFVHGRQSPHSDVDLLVEFTEAPGNFSYFEPLEYLQTLLGRNVDVVQPGALRGDLRDSVLNDAVYVFSALGRIVRR
ncbi:MAG: nucleotidyltransferase [Actinobacteria bacterium HGW-Actinobacteria-7]|jgi:hypothetical protein|nr:MAG: nucleotidyltransferase [Actinobacteria bacterium HGW-Actinobacteria-7]